MTEYWATEASTVPATRASAADWQWVLQRLRQGSQTTLGQLTEAGLLELPLVAALADDLASALGALALLSRRTAAHP